MTKVLYVEDNDDNVYMMKMQFELLDGFEFMTAEDGEAGYVKARVELPDLILMDLDLPIVDGWELTRRLKSDSTTRHIPVIALTAHARAEDIDRAFASGFQIHVAKPVDASRLLSTIATLVHEPVTSIPPSDRA